MATASTELLVTEDAWRQNIATFAQIASRGQWIPYRWLYLLTKAVQPLIVRGGARIIINAPPRHGKSLTFSHWLPTWYLEWFPENRVLLGSYSDTFAAHWGRRVREEFQKNELLETKLSKTKKESSDWETANDGGMKTFGAQGGVTGRGGHLVGIDDPHKDWEEAQSSTIRGKVIDRFNADVYTRLEPNASIIVTQTRWHEEDLTGYLMNEHSDDWQVIRLPAIAEEDDVLGRAVGEALCPERFPIEALERIRKAQGSYLFNGLYQQRPAPPEGGMIKRDWFRRWDILPECTRYIQSWDLTFSGTGTSYVVGQVWGVKGPDYFLLDQRRDRFDFPETLRAIRAMSARWPQAKEKLVEKAANGYAAIATLQKDLDGVIGIKPQGSKEARLAAVSGLIEAGNVWIPSKAVAPWADDMIEEVVSFPNAKNDDQADTMTMALARLAKRTTQNIMIPTSGARSRPTEFASAKV